MEKTHKNIPPELENILLEFTINVIVEKPEDIISHAADYFTRLRDQKNSLTKTVTISKEVQEIEDPRESVSNILGSKTFQRRGTVMGERYNPEEDDEEDDDIVIIAKTDEERQRIKKQSCDIFLFRVLDDIDLSAVIDAMRPTPVKKDEVIIKQGDDGDFFYLIDKGDFDIFIKSDGEEEKHIATYEGKGYFGELALLHNQPRAATIKAATDGLLWAVDRKTFNKLIVKRAFEKRQKYMKLLEGVDQLKPLTEYERMQVADALIGKAYQKGDVIVREGDEGDGMYFIVEGKVTVRQMKDNRDVEINQLGEGKFFGEIALVKDQPRAATVIALEDTRAAFLEVKAFERLLGPCMKIMARHIETYK